MNGLVRGVPVSESAAQTRARPIIKRLAGRDAPVMAEVGVSAATLAVLLLRACPDLLWHGIDPWAGQDEQRNPLYAATGDVHAKLTAAQAANGYERTRTVLRPFADRATIHRAWSPDAADHFARNALDLVFIDADHSEEGTLADMQGWWPRVAPGGWLGGHDYANPDPRFRFGVDDAVHAFSAAVRVPFDLDGGNTWWMRKP